MTEFRDSCIWFLNLPTETNPEAPNLEGLQFDSVPVEGIIVDVDYFVGGLLPLVGLL